MHPEFPILNRGVSEPVDDGYMHLACGTALQGMKVILSHRDGLSPESGDGSTETLIVPFCPTCNSSPPERGTFMDNGRISHPSVVNVED